jgi:hypothetical protein
MQVRRSKNTEYLECMRLLHFTLGHPGIQREFTLAITNDSTRDMVSLTMKKIAGSKKEPAASINSQ